MDLFDWNPQTGVAEYLDVDTQGTIIMRTEQDVEPLLDHNRILRNGALKDTPLRDDQPMFRHYASVPMTVILEMQNNGIDFFAKEDFHKVISEINTKYPYLKVTEKTLTVPK